MNHCVSKLITSVIGVLFVVPFLSSCDDTPTYTRQPIVPQLPAMRMSFSKPVGSLSLKYTLESEGMRAVVSRNKVSKNFAFIDLNNNRLYDKGEELSPEFEGTITLPKELSEVTMYGPFETLEVKDDRLVALSGDAVGGLSALSINNPLMPADVVTRIIALLSKNLTGSEQTLTIDDHNISARQIEDAVSKGWVVKGLKGQVVDPYTDLMLLYFKGEPGRSIKLDLDAFAAKSDCWIDYNDNGVKDEGEAFAQKELPEALEVTLGEDGKQMVPIYGNVTHFMIADGERAVSADFAVGARVVRSAELTDFKWGAQMGIEAVDMQSAEVLASLSVMNNPLKDLKLPGKTTLKKLYLSGSPLASLDLKPYTNLVELKAEKMGLKSITLPRDNTSTQFRIWLNNNELTSIDLSTSPRLSQLYVNKNKLSSLILGDPKIYTAFQLLECNDNLLTSVNFAEIRLLSTISCRNNLFETLDFNHPEGLQTRLTNIDLSGNQKLKTFRADKVQNLNKVNLKDTPLYDLSTFVPSVPKVSNPWRKGTLIIEASRITPERQSQLTEHGWVTKE